MIGASKWPDADTTREDAVQSSECHGQKAAGPVTGAGCDVLGVLLSRVAGQAPRERAEAKAEDEQFAKAKRS